MNNCHFIAINFTQDKIYNRIKYILLCAAWLMRITEFKVKI